MGNRGASQVLVVADFIIMKCQPCYSNQLQSYQLYFFVTSMLRRKYVSYSDF